MIEPIAAASETKEQRLFCESHKVPIIMTIQVSWTDLVIFGSRDFFQQLNFSFRKVSEIGAKFFLLEAHEARRQPGARWQLLSIRSAGIF